MSKKEKEINRILEDFDMIQDSDNSEFDISQHLANIDDLPNLGAISVYDYDSDLTTSSQKALEVLESLVDLYLGDFPELKKHPYIRNKLKEDAMVYAETHFLQKMTRRNFLTQLKQVDNGDNSARMHEVVNQTISQVRENSKFASSQRNDLEKFWKDFRSDVQEVSKTLGSESKEDDSSGVTDSRDLNDMIAEALIKNKKEPT